jgi:hypothetical protein
MSEGNEWPWGHNTEPPHGWICRICGQVILKGVPCPKDSRGVHQRSHEATVRWHRRMERGS